jgi:hypothetical protein
MGYDSRLRTWRLTRAERGFITFGDPRNDFRIGITQEIWQVDIDISKVHNLLLGRSESMPLKGVWVRSGNLCIN